MLRVMRLMMNVIVIHFFMISTFVPRCLFIVRNQMKIFLLQVNLRKGPPTKMKAEEIIIHCLILVIVFFIGMLLFQVWKYLNSKALASQTVLDDLAKDCMIISAGPILAETEKPQVLSNFFENQNRSEPTSVKHKEPNKNRNRN